MPDKLTDRPPDVALIPEAMTALIREQSQWTKDVLHEAGRLAAEHGNGMEDDTITAGDISRAVKILRARQTPGAAATLLSVIGQITSYVAAIIAGLFINNIDETWGAVGLTISVFVGLIAALMYLLPGKRFQS